MTTDIATTQQPPAVITPADMLKIAVEQGADLDKLEKLMDLQHRWEADQARKAFNEAVANFKLNAPRLVQDKLVDFTTAKGRTRYTYADLDSVTQKLAPALAKWGLSHSWSTAQEGEQIRVTCRLAHREGHFEEVTLSGPPDQTGNKNSIQAIKSSVSYLSRITLLAVTGLATGVDDDDGRGASGGAGLITAEQKDKLVELLKETGADVVKFLGWLGVPTLDEAPAHRFDEAERMLKRKRKQGEG